LDLFESDKSTPPPAKYIQGLDVIKISAAPFKIEPVILKFPELLKYNLILKNIQINV